jgi:hypothetical protein
MASRSGQALIDVCSRGQYLACGSQIMTLKFGRKFPVLDEELP